MSRQINKQFSSVTPLIINGPAGGVFDCGETVPSDGALGYAPNCIFIDDDASGTGGLGVYVNTGTAAAAAFRQFFGGIDLTALVTTSTELNLLSGLTATSAELNRAAKNSTREVVVAPGGADSTLTVTQALHDGRTVVIDNATKALTVNLPAATGTGARFKFFLGTSITNGAGNSITFVATGAHLFGNAFVFSDNAAQAVIGWPAAGSTSINFDGTTKGGLKGDWIELEDCATSKISVRAFIRQTGTEATCFG